MATLNHKSDEELMVAYQRGEEQAFSILYTRYSPRVYGYLRNHLRQDFSFVDDVFQAVFLKLHNSRSHYDPAFPFVPWLFTVCRSVMIDSLRQQGRIKEEFQEGALENAVAAGGEIQQDNVMQELPSLKGLPRDQHQALQMRYQDDLSFEEIAQRLNKSPANVRQLVSRAVRRLRKGEGGP